MTPFTSKVCIVGDFAVGKTSVVERFVNNQFSEKYLTTVGVKIDTKEIELPARDVRLKLIIWDVAGSDRFSHVEFSYLRGAAAYVFVADGTRAVTIEAAESLRREIEERYGAKPSVMLVNKSDLVDGWEVSDDRLAKLGERYGQVFRTSAKTGDAVELALIRLAELIIDTELGAAE